MRLFDFQALDPNIVWALEPKVLKLEVSSFRARPSIYVLKGYYDDPPLYAVLLIKINFWENLIFNSTYLEEYTNN